MAIRRARPAARRLGRRSPAAFGAGRVARFLGDRRADLPRAARRHLPHRPRRADRSGAGRRRRPRAGRRLRARARSSSASTCRSWQQFCDLRRARSLTRRFRHARCSPRNPVLDGHRARLSRRRSSSPRSAPSIGVAARRAAGRARRGRASGALARPARARRRPDRLFGAGLLARPGGAAALLRQARLGRRARAASTSPTTYIVDAGDRPASCSTAAMQGEWDASSATRSRTSSCRPRCSAISRSPTSAA